jgi:hypothetical protein
MYGLITQASTSLSAKYFAALKDRSAPVDALEEWLSSAPVVTSSDGITWWTAMQATGHPLAHMSLDFLSTPGMSSLALTKFLLMKLQ